MSTYDPYYANVILLLRGNGTDNSQTITDDKSHSVTVTGNTCIKTANPKFGTGSIYFDGNGDYLSIPSTDFTIATSGHFAIDAWVYLTSYNGTLFTGGSAATRPRLSVNSSGYLVFAIANVVTITSSIPISLNTWTYVAVNRTTDVIRMYIGKDLVGSSSTNYSIAFDSTVTIGRWISGTTDYLTGYIDDLRYTKAERYNTSVIRIPTSEAATNNVPPDITLTSIVPYKGPTAGGTFVTLTGTGFTDYTTCTIDGNSLTTMLTVSGTELTGYTPPGTLGLKDVVVTNP